MRVKFAFRLFFIVNTLSFFGGRELVMAQSIHYDMLGGTCGQATRICTKDTIFVNRTTNGLKGTSTNKPSCAGLIPQQTVFLKFTVKKSGTLNFSINPVSDLSEYDWALYENYTCNPGAQPSGQILVGYDGQDTLCKLNCGGCNFYSNKATPPDGTTGMRAGGKNTLPFANEINVTACNEYLLAIDHYGERKNGGYNAPNPDSGFNISFGGTFEIDPMADYTINNNTSDIVTICCAPAVVDFKDISLYDNVCPFTYNWNFGNSKTSAKKDDTSTYTQSGIYNTVLNLTSTADGCTYTKNKTIVILPPSHIYVPSVFYPKSDQDSSKYFTVDLPPTGITKYAVTVFDRWGKIIFKTTDPSLGARWNGTFNNDGTTEMPVGIYIYSVKAEFLDGNNKDLYGTVSIAR